jgi:hypothetical protein
MGIALGHDDEWATLGRPVQGVEDRPIDGGRIAVLNEDTLLHVAGP